MTIIDRGDARPLQLKQKQPQQSEQQAAAAEADRLSAAAVVEAEQLSSWLLPPPALLLLAVACLLVGAGSPGTGHRVARPQHQAICIARRRGACICVLDYPGRIWPDLLDCKTCPWTGFCNVW